MTRAGLLAWCTVLGLTVVSGAVSARDWSAPTDFGKIRAEYGARDDFKTICEDDRPNSAIAAALNAKDWATADRLSQAWLDSCPVDAQIHLLRGAALLEMGNRAGAEQHKRWFIGLIDSVKASGNGKTAETAYETISVIEEYAVLLALGLKPQKQLVLDGPAVDAIQVENASGVAATIYLIRRRIFAAS